MCFRVLEKLSRKRPSPLIHSKVNTWTCGIIYAIGENNFLFDKSIEPYMCATDLAKYFGISSSTAYNKAYEIRKLLKMARLSEEYVVKSVLPRIKSINNTQKTLEKIVELFKSI